MSTLKLVVGTILIGIGIMIVISFWRFGHILGFYMIYPWIVSKISGSIINPHLVNIAALFITSLLYFGIYRGIYKKNKEWGFAIIVLVMVIQSFSLFMVERDRFFSAISGEPLKYYTTNPMTGELQVFDAQIFDAFGQKAQLVDFKTAQDIYRQQNSNIFPNSEIAYESIKNFFNSRTGSALMFYCKDVNNQYHFFIHDGYDPISGAKLQPVTEAVMKEMQKGKSSVSPTAKPVGDSMCEIESKDIENYFDPKTGKAIVFYSKDGWGYHFFARDGFDPTNGKKLLPVDHAVMKDAMRNYNLDITRYSVRF